MRSARGTASTAYERAIDDPRFARRFRAAYHGGDDPLDALWWLDHPTETAPGGADPPAARTAAARRALYRPDPAPDAVARFRSAADHEAAARSAALTALARADRRAPGPAGLAPADARPLMRPRPDPVSVSPLGWDVASRFAGRPEHLLADSGGWPRSALLTSVPRASVFAAEITATVVCMFLVTDAGEIEGVSASRPEYCDAGLVLQPAAGTAQRTGLARIAWAPSGELTWWTIAPADDPW